jgi:hypothetical protein
MSGLAIPANKFGMKAMIGFVGLLSLSPAHAAEAPPIIPSKITAVFDCHFSNDNNIPVYFCLLKPKAKFLGAVLGMPKNQAFGQLCKQMPDARWSVRTANPTSFSAPQKGLTCEDWTKFANSTYWMLGSEGFPCAGQRVTTINVNADAVSRVSVICPPVHRR